MSGWLRKLFKRFDVEGEGQAKVGPEDPTSPATGQTGHELNQSLIENQADIQNEIAAGPYTARLVVTGLLPERITAELARLLAIDQAGVGHLVSGVPVIVAQNITEAFAFQIQRDLQMFGAVVDVYTNIEDEVPLDDSGASSLPRPGGFSPSQSAEEEPLIERTSGEFQVYIRSLGPHPEPILPFLQGWLKNIKLCLLRAIASSRISTRLNQPL